MADMVLNSNDSVFKRNIHYQKDYSLIGAFTLGFLSFKSDQSPEVLSLFGLVLSIPFQPTNQGGTLFTIHGGEGPRLSLFLLTIYSQPRLLETTGWDCRRHQCAYYSWRLKRSVLFYYFILPGSCLLPISFFWSPVSYQRGGKREREMLMDYKPGKMSSLAERGKLVHMLNVLLAFGLYSQSELLVWVDQRF